MLREKEVCFLSPLIRGNQGYPHHYPLNAAQLRCFTQVGGEGFGFLGKWRHYVNMYADTDVSVQLNYLTREKEYF